MAVGAPKHLTKCRRFFAEPVHPRHRMYEALRAFFLDGRPSYEVARDFGKNRSALGEFGRVEIQASRSPLESA